MNWAQRIATWRMSRGEYAAWGIGLVLVKYNLDRVFALGFGHRPFFPWNYVVPAEGASLAHLAQIEPKFGMALVLTAIPFVVAGIALTVARLRSAGWPLWLAILFFLPVINVIFFAVLCWVPGGDVPPRLPGSGWRGWLRWVLPRAPLATATVAVVFSAVASVALTQLSVAWLGNYGAGLFFALPFAMGFVAVLLMSVHARCGYGLAVAVSLLTVLVSGGLLLAFAFEGIICLLMALPISTVMAYLGGTVAWIIQRQAWEYRQQGNAICAVLAVMPAIFWTDRLSEPPLRTCVTDVGIASPPEEVWAHVVSFSRIAPPREWVFQTGIAYPIEAVIEGEGVGAVRRCRFSTGDFVEPITAWEKPSRLAFDVRSQPHPMREVSPYREIHPPHLEGYLTSRRGEFRLVRRADGGTNLRGTTWYVQRLWPQAYWAPVTDYLLHSIHRRVLEHIRDECEAPAIARGAG